MRVSAPGVDRQAGRGGGCGQVGQGRAQARGQRGRGVMYPHRPPRQIVILRRAAAGLRGGRPIDFKGLVEVIVQAGWGQAHRDRFAPAGRGLGQPFSSNSRIGSIWIRFAISAYLYITGCVKARVEPGGSAAPDRAPAPDEAGFGGSVAAGISRASRNNSATNWSTAAATSGRAPVYCVMTASAASVAVAPAATACQISTAVPS